MGGAVIIFACIDHFCLGLLTLTASHLPHMHRLRETKSLVYFLGSFIDCQGKRKPEKLISKIKLYTECSCFSN